MNVARSRKAYSLLWQQVWKDGGQFGNIKIPYPKNKGEMGIRAITCLTRFANGFKDAVTEYDILQRYYTVYGYATCCRECGFLTDECYWDFLDNIENVADNEIIRIRNIGEHN